MPMRYDQFFTPVKINKINQIDSFDTAFGFIGSCFSDHMHQRFRHHGLKAWMSPYGTTYNPLSIANQLISSIDLTNKFNLHTHENSSFYWETSHKIVLSNPADLTYAVDAMRAESMNALCYLNTLFITLGTSWVYELSDTGLLVANCHKLPANHFTKRLLEIGEITAALTHLITSLISFNPRINIVLTVSPVRHLRDGIIENTRSKARLIEACHKLVESNHECSYFPSFELLMDEFRDYRFYEKDGVHPTEFAIDLVFDKLTDVLFTERFKKVLLDVSRVRQMEQHRFSAQSNSIDIEKHQKQILRSKENLDAQHQVHW
jgi:GSCFA family